MYAPSEVMQGSEGTLGWGWTLTSSAQLHYLQMQYGSRHLSRRVEAACGIALRILRRHLNRAREKVQ